MLFHLTMTHSAETCPNYLPLNEQKKVLAQWEKSLITAKQQNIRIQFMVTTVGHTQYALVEADNMIDLNKFFHSIQLKQDIHVEPVGDLKAAISAAKKGTKKQAVKGHK